VFDGDELYCCSQNFKTISENSTCIQSTFAYLESTMIHHLSHFLCKLLLVGFLISTFCNSALAQSRFQSLNHLLANRGTGTLAGQHNKEPNAEPAKWTTWVQANVGKTPALWSGDFLFGQDDIQNRGHMIEEAQRQWEQGAAISILWHACSPASPEPCRWRAVKRKLTDDQWQQLFVDGSELNKNLVSRLDDLGKHLNYLKDNHVEVLFRPFHEMNQAEFWWGGRKGPEGSAKLFRYVHDYLTKTKGLNNLIWVYDLQDFPSLATDVTDYDPGEAYWDVLALDVYRSDGKGYTQEKYDIIDAYAKEKPFAIGECDILPTAKELETQPKWAFFMCWAELLPGKNNLDDIRNIYNSSNIITLDKMPGWKKTP
jgi:mannan endo-1,4-beta-mannosidase